MSEIGEWEKIAAAVALIATGAAERIDGVTWKAYRSGSIIRIDISEAAK